jgi:hypothetical protein
MPPSERAYGARTCVRRRQTPLTRRSRYPIDWLKRGLGNTTGHCDQPAKVRMRPFGRGSKAIRIRTTGVGLARDRSHRGAVSGADAALARALPRLPAARHRAAGRHLRRRGSGRARHVAQPARLATALARRSNTDLRLWLGEKDRQHAALSIRQAPSSSPRRVDCRRERSATHSVGAELRKLDDVSLALPTTRIQGRSRSRARSRLPTVLLRSFVRPIFQRGHDPGAASHAPHASPVLLSAG